jgi:hypothetical protein
MIKSKIRWAGNVTRIRRKRKAYRLLLGKPEGKRSLGRPRCRWVNNVRMHVGEKKDRVVFTGLIWLRIGISGRLL